MFAALQNKPVLKRTFTLIFVALIYSSLLAQTVHVSAQQSDPFVSSNSCAKLAINGITASGGDPLNPLANAFDQKLNTRWSNLGLGSWIQIDLGQENTVCSVGVNWHRGDERINTFVISSSADGKTFTDVFSGKSDKSLAEQSYNINPNTARYIRVTVIGNTQNNWVSIAELKIYGYKISTQSCASSPIIKATAPSSQDGYPPTNAIDNNLDTIWSSYGIGSSILLDLGAGKNVCSVDIAWYKGNERQNNFVISTSLDGVSFKTVLTAKSTGSTLSFEKYMFADNFARYVKITVNGNTQNSYASISEARVQVPIGQNEANCSDAAIDKQDIKASGGQTSFPVTNVVDKDLNTRWSNFGVGSWIEADMGDIKKICSVNIAWYNGNERQNDFVISVSDDGLEFVDVQAAKSSGTTLNTEKYSLASSDIDARYIRVTVNGNTQNEWASITELSVDIFPAPSAIPALDTSKTLRIGVVGDVDNNEGFVTQMNLMKKYGVQQFILAGDYAYTNGPAVLDKAAAAGYTKSNTIIAVGNHDSCSSIKTYLGNSLCYYQKTVGNVDFFVIDANSDFDCSGTQYQTITSKIHTSAATHKVVVVHQPFVTVKSMHEPNGKFPCFDPIFQNNGVDLVVQAHNHNYQMAKIGSIFYGLFGTGTHDTGSSMYSCESTTFNSIPVKCITKTNGLEIIDLSKSFNSIKGYFISNDDKLVDSWNN